MTDTYYSDRVVHPTTRTRSDLAALRTMPPPFQHRYLRPTRVLNHTIPLMGHHQGVVVQLPVVCILYPF
jgi:hypothetical protein